MTTTTEKRTPIALVALLSFALLINYVDRGSIGIAAPLIQTEFHLSPSQMGWVLVAFFWAYAPMQPFMGWLADRIGAERVSSPASASGRSLPCSLVWPPAS